MSIQYFLTKLLIRLTGIKKINSLPPDKLIPFVRLLNRRYPFRLPKDDDFDYADEAVDVDTTGRGTRRFHCLAIRHKKDDGTKKEGAILHLYGGGMLLAPPRRFIDYARKMAARTGKDVWFPYYPLCTYFSPVDSIDMISKIHKKMAAEYQDMSWYGYSAGGALALLLGAYRNTLPEKDRDQMPQRAVLISPGGLPDNKAEWDEMQSLGTRDIMIAPKLLSSLKEIIDGTESDLPAYMISRDDIDITGFPETWIYYGTDEILSAKAPAYTRLFERSRIPCHLKMAPGMAHCYCVVDSFPEARQDYDEIINILRT